MHWNPIESPITKAKGAAYKLIVQVRAAFILLRSAWHMEPRHFRPGTHSIYKNLGWWIPLVPGSVYAGAVQFLLAPAITEVAPDFPVNYLPVGNIIFIVFFAHLLTTTHFGFHALMCRVGRILQMQESPPPYEFFLVRASGSLMWFAVAIWVVTLPALAQEQNEIGYFASLIMAVPLIWISLFAVASFFCQRAESAGKVGLKKMYQSERFLRLFWRTECGLFITIVLVLIFLARHPDLLVRLLMPQH